MLNVKSKQVVWLRGEGGNEALLDLPGCATVHVSFHGIITNQETIL